MFVGNSSCYCYPEKQFSVKSSCGADVLVLILLVVLSLLLYYSGTWGDYLNALKSSARIQNMSVSSNRSLFATVSRIFPHPESCKLISDLSMRQAVAEEVSSLTRLLGIWMSFGYLILCIYRLTEKFKHCIKSDPVFLALWIAWVSVGLVPIVFDHYGLLLIPLTAECFRRCYTRLGITLLLGFCWWTLAPFISIDFTNIWIILYESTRPLVILIVGLYALKIPHGKQEHHTYQKTT